MSGTLRRSGSSEATGITWLDQAGEALVQVRESRAIGLPAPAPDFFGLAIRVPTEDGSHGDLLFASTGLGLLTRYTLTVALSPHRRPMTTLLPYRTSAGPVLLSATFRSARTIELAWARGSGAWSVFGEVLLDEAPDEAADGLVSFDPVTNTLPGLEVYDWVRRLREPSYATARRSRRD